MAVLMLLVTFTSQLSAQVTEPAPAAEPAKTSKKGKAQKAEAKAEKAAAKEQKSEGKEQRLEDLKALKAELALSDDQVSKIKALVDQRKANAAANKGLDKEARKENMKKFNQELKSILDEEQYKKLNANRKDKMQQRKKDSGK
jgi:hypothetical protein